MEPSRPKPTLDFMRQEAIQDMKNRLSDPSASGKMMRNQLRDGTLDRMELSNGRVQPISPERFPELYQWFREQEVAMGIIKPSPDAKLAMMTPKVWGGAEDDTAGDAGRENTLDRSEATGHDHPVTTPPTKPTRK